MLNSINSIDLKAIFLKKRSSYSVSWLLTLLCMLSACDLSPNDPNCIGELTANGPAWVEKTVMVNAQVGPVDEDEVANPQEGWVPANLTVIKDMKIGFEVEQIINLCSEGVNKTFGPNENGSKNSQIVVPATTNWTGKHSLKSKAEMYDGNLIGDGREVNIDKTKFKNGWYDTGIEVSGETTVSMSVKGSYSPILVYAGTYPNGGWSSKANKADGVFPKLGGTSSSLDNQFKALTNAASAKYDLINDNEELTDEEKAIQIKAVEDKLAEDLQDVVADTPGTGLSATGGKGLFVYVGTEPPGSDWFGAANENDTGAIDANRDGVINDEDFRISHQYQPHTRDNFFELYSVNGSGYFDFPPLSDDLLKPNKIYIRYADDFFNRPTNPVHLYKCDAPFIQTNFGRGEQCIFPFYPPITTSSKAISPKGGGWVWRSQEYYHAGKVKKLNSYEDNSGGYTLEISYNCTGSMGRYLDAKVISADGESHYFGNPIGKYSYFEHNLLRPSKSIWGDAKNELKELNAPVAPASGSLYFRVIDEDGNGDGDGLYNNNQGSYQVTVGTYVLSDDVGIVSELIYKLIIKPIRGIFLGTDNDPGAAQLMFEKITGESGYGPRTLVNIIRAMILLYIVLYAIQFIFGFIEDTRTDFFFRLLRIAVILQLIHPDSWEFFSKYLFNVFIDGSLDLIRTFTSQFSLDTSTGFNDGDNPEDPFAFFNITFNLLGNGFFWKKITALFLSPFSGWIYLAFVFACFWWFIMGVIYAVYIYLVCIVAVAFLLALAPIFIAMGLFNNTRESFNNWLRQLASYTMQPVMMLIALSILNLFIYSVFYRIASIPICKTCFVSISMDWLFNAPDICLIRDHAIWVADPSNPNETMSFAITFFTVFVFITIVSCMRAISHTATSLAASIFGGSPMGAITGKEAGLPKESFYRKPLDMAKNKARDKTVGAANRTAARALGTRAGGALGFERRGVEYSKANNAKIKSMSDSNLNKPFRRASQAYKKAGVFGAVAGFAAGSVEAIARPLTNIAASAFFDKDVRPGDIGSESTAKKAAKTEKAEEVEATGGADE